MFPNIPPSTNDLSGAISVLNIITNPKEAQAYLDQLATQSKQLAEQHKEIDQARFDLQTAQSDLNTKENALADLKEELAVVSETLKKRLDKADERDVEAATKEKELLIRERSVSDIEIKHKEKDNYLGNMHQDLMNKHQSLDQERAQVAATQSALDQRIAKINSVLQS